MRTITSLIAILLVGACIAAPASDKDDDGPLIISKEFYIKDLIKYSSEHDIVKVMVPLNSINFDDSESSESNSSEEGDVLIFFVEADADENGDRVYKGLYSFKNGKAKKILENGRDAAASADDSKQVFFGASDGIYVYNQKDDSAEKYGSVDDSIIGIAKEKTGDVIYILSDNHIVYKISENGTKKEKLEDIVNAKQIVLDFADNLYFYSDDKVPHIRSAEGVKKIEGLPSNPSYAELVRPPFLLEDGVLFVSDRVSYILYANGTSEHSGFEIKSDARPSAYAPDGALVQYYAYDKKIYEYNVLKLMLGTDLDDLNNFFSEKSEEIRSVAAKSKSSLRH